MNYELNELFREIEDKFNLGKEHISGCYGSIKPDLVKCNACKWLELKKKWEEASGNSNKSKW